MKMRAAVLREFEKPATIEEVELEPPREKEVLIRTAFTGFCQSDLHFMRGRVNFGLPGVLGHEAAGIVEDVGPGVTSVKKGDHVVATWMVPCGTCPECVSGRGYICRSSIELFSSGLLPDKTSRLKDWKGRQLGHQTFVSGFAEYMVVPEKGAVKVKEELPLDQACFMGCCLPTGFGAVYNGAGVKPGDSVAIWGMGGVGLNAVRGAKLRSAYPISKEDPVPIVKELTGGGAKYTFEVIGDPGAVLQALWTIALGGKHIQIGICPPMDMVGVPLTFLTGHCNSIVGTQYGMIQTHQDIPAFVDMALRGELLLDRLVTRKFKVEEINDVAEAMKQRQIVGRWVCEW